MIRNIVLDPILPLGLVLFLGAILLAATGYIYFSLGTRLNKVQNAVLTLFRLTGVALVLVLLLQPSRLEEIPQPNISKITLVGLDTSRSMKQEDVNKATRLEAAKNILYDAGFVARSGVANPAEARVFEFSEDAALAPALTDLKPRGATTRIHRSVVNMINSLSVQEGARALILLSDGHDFEMVNPQKTGFLARSRQVPIYAVPLGRQGKVRDTSARITNYQPYSYVKQKTRITALVRLVGCEFEDINIQLLRMNEVVQTQRLNAEENSQLNVQFEVVENDIGQYEYEIKVLPLEHEVDLANNSAITYLNVIDQQIQALLLEGSPYWDTTFLQRSILRNDKVNLDALIQYAPQKVRAIRKKSGEELKVPETQEQFNKYDLIILGRSIQHLLDPKRIGELTEYVRQHGGTVIFSRGRAFDGQAANELEPVLWDDKASERVRLQIGREGSSIAPFKMLTEQSGGLDALPDLIAGHSATDRKPLSATLAQAQNRDGGDVLPGMVHRRFGQGQVLSVGVDGLWRWAFNAKIEGVNTLFDRFWDQMILWLMAGRDFVPNKQFSFRASSANILLGEKVYFRLVQRTLDPAVKSIPVTLYQDSKEIGRTTLNIADPNDPYRLSADFLPDKTGKYRAVARLPDGAQEETKFIVFEENLEDTEVATDVGYLKKLCESSGGKLVTPDELARLRLELNAAPIDDKPKTKLRTLWDQTWVFYLIGLVFAVDWSLRRKWGLN